MNEQNRDYISQGTSGTAQLPNATATLVLGILSIVVCFICGIVALVISNKDMAEYRANPGLYSESSYSSLRAGRICSIIGIALQVLGLLVYIVFIVFFISVAASNVNS
ncbi:MAG TPA: CCC motif membrane protein [Ferruginibacter sp.]|nr:hypothetical protein [Chitinophagaceae bacterium]HRI26281.1 CCC motif membrane protein [Ferruginibacter sp.]